MERPQKKASPRSVAAATLRGEKTPQATHTTSASSASTLDAMLDKPTDKPQARPMKPRPVARPARPLPGLPPTPVGAATSTTDSTTQPPADDRPCTQNADPGAARAPIPAEENENNASSSSPDALSSSSSSVSPAVPSSVEEAEAADRPQVYSSSSSFSSSSASAPSRPQASSPSSADPTSPSPLRPAVPARPSVLTAKKPPVPPSRRPPGSPAPSSPVPPPRSEAIGVGASASAPSSSSLSSSLSYSTPSAPAPGAEASPSSPSPSPPSSSYATASPPSSSGPVSGGSPSLVLTPSSPSSSGDAIPTAAQLSSSDSPRQTVEKSSTYVDTSSSHRSAASGSFPSSSSLLSVFSSSNSTPVEDLEKRLRKVKEKKEKLAKELRRLEDEERELEEKLKEAREREEKDESGTGGGGGGSRGKKVSRRGSTIIRTDSNGDKSLSLASSSSLTLSPGGPSSLSSSGSGIASAASSSSAANLHRRVGSLVLKNKNKKKRGSSLVLYGEKEKEKEAAGLVSSPRSASAQPTEFDLSVPRQFYCKRTGSVTFKVATSYDVASAPPTKKYAREVRRKKCMLYIDAGSIQVMVPEEKTAKFDMADIKNVGYSIKQFFMVVVKHRRKTAELFEFKTREGQDVFDWVVALKNEDKKKKEKVQADKESTTSDEQQQSPEKKDAGEGSPEDQQTPAPASEVGHSAPAPSPDGSSSDRGEWSVAFIAPIVLDNEAGEEDDDDLDEESSGSIISGRGDNESDDDASDFPTISSPTTTARSTVPQKKVIDIHRETLLELLATERNYNTDLDLLVEVWMAKLKESKLVDPADMSAIFSNTEQIRNLNKVLLNSLDGLDALPMESLNVGERFQTFIAYLKFYTQYCSNYEVAHSRLVSLKEAKWELPPFLESIQSRKECKNLDLESYLIKPMQRLTKYPLLIQALLRHTPPTHPDYDNLARCYDGVQKVVLAVNENKRKNENLTKLMQVQQEFLEPGLKLVEATRKFLREGTFPRVTLGANCTVLLFNDIVVLAVKKKNKYQAKSGKIALRGSYVWEDRAVKNGFTVVGREAGDKITVEAATEQEKTQWMEEVSQALINLPHNSLLGGSSSPATAEKYVRQSEGGKE